MDKVQFFCTHHPPAGRDNLAQALDDYCVFNGPGCRIRRSVYRRLGFPAGVVAAVSQVSMEWTANSRGSPAPKHEVEPSLTRSWIAIRTGPW